jgi:hypothetical protein
MTLRLAAALLCLLASASALAQAVPGQPLRLRYGPAEYGGPPGQQGLAITREGMLAVAASQDLLVYDGDTWAPVPMPGRQVAQSIARGHDGRIYAGAYDTFGVLEPMDGGGWSYRDLRDRAGLEGEARALGYIWQLLPVEDGLYVRADATLVFVPYDAALPAKHWPIPLETRLMFDVGDGIVVRVDGLGLSRLEDGRFQRVPGGEHFADEPLVGVYVREHDWLLIGDDGFHSATPAGIRLLPTSASAFDDFDPYTSIELADGSLVIGGNGGELAHFGPDLAPRGLYPLGTGAVRALAIDHEGALWAGTERDLHRLRIPSPWTQLGASQGLRGQVFDMAWHRGQLYLGGSQGLARLRVDRGRVRTAATRCWWAIAPAWPRSIPTPTRRASCWPRRRTWPSCCSPASGRTAAGRWVRGTSTPSRCATAAGRCSAAIRCAAPRPSGRWSSRPASCGWTTSAAVPSACAWTSRPARCSSAPASAPSRAWCWPRASAAACSRSTAGCTR